MRSRPRRTREEIVASSSTKPLSRGDVVETKFFDRTGEVGEGRRYRLLGRTPGSHNDWAVVELLHASAPGSHNDWAVVELLHASAELDPLPPHEGSSASTSWPRWVSVPSPLVPSTPGEGVVITSSDGLARRRGKGADDPLAHRRNCSWFLGASSSTRWTTRETTLEFAPFLARANDIPASRPFTRTIAQLSMRPDALRASGTCLWMMARR